MTNTSSRSFTFALLLAAFHAVALAAQANGKGTQDSSSAHFTLGTAQSMVGYARFDFADLDARFAAAGLPKVAGTAATIGIGADLRNGRLLFGAGYQSLLARNTTDAAYRTRMSGSYSLFDLGYAVVNRRRLAIYPVVGVGVTTLALNVRERGDFDFNDGLHTPARELGLSGASGIIHAGMVVEQRFQRGQGAEFAISVRYGITRSVGSQGWQSDESHVSEGPNGARGSYLRFAFSKPLQSRRDGILPIAATALQSIVR